MCCVAVVVIPISVFLPAIRTWLRARVSGLAAEIRPSLCYPYRHNTKVIAALKSCFSPVWFAELRCVIHRESRDPHGNLQKHSRNRHLWEPQFNDHDGKHDQHGDVSNNKDHHPIHNNLESRNLHHKLFDQHTPTVDPVATHDDTMVRSNPICKSQEAPRTRRMLPRVPTLRADHAVREERNTTTYCSDNTDHILPGPIAHTDAHFTTTYETSSGDAHPDHETLLARDAAFAANGAGRTIVPSSNYGPFKWPEPKWTHKVLTNDERPPWNGSNTILGADIEPALGRNARFAQTKQQHADRHLLQSLRVPDDPNVQWRRDRISSVIAADREAGLDEDDMPDVFVRLLDPGKFNSTHKHRFSETGVGMGLEGRRDDNDHEINVAGQAQILRTLEPAMDQPHKPLMPWELARMRTDSCYTVDINPNHSSQDAYDDPIMSDNGIYGKLAAEHHSTKVRDGGDYETMRKARKSFNIDSHEVKPWQHSDAEVRPARRPSVTVGVKSYHQATLGGGVGTTADLHMHM